LLYLNRAPHIDPLSSGKFSSGYWNVANVSILELGLNTFTGSPHSGDGAGAINNSLKVD